jgi:uncharacterized membrane protein (DUF4010 family)
VCGHLCNRNVAHALKSAVADAAAPAAAPAAVPAGAPAEEVKKGIAITLGKPHVTQQLQVTQLWHVLPTGALVLVTGRAQVQGE